MEKTTLRSQMRQLRNALTQGQCKAFSNEIFQILYHTETYQKASHIFFYMHLKNEVQTNQMIMQALLDYKHVYVPKVQGDVMNFYEISSLNDCEPGCMNILEPKDHLHPFLYEDFKNHKKSELLMILPGLGFDENGNRIGYGGGYYDKFLEDKTNITKCGIAYEIQVVNNIKAESNDIKLDMLITNVEKRIFAND